MNLGFSHQVIVSEVEGITIEVPSPNKIVIHGCAVLHFSIHKSARPI